MPWIKDIQGDLVFVSTRKSVTISWSGMDTIHYRNQVKISLHMVWHSLTYLKMVAPANTERGYHDTMCD